MLKNKTFNCAHLESNFRKKIGLRKANESAINLLNLKNVKNQLPPPTIPSQNTIKQNDTGNNTVMEIVMTSSKTKQHEE